MQNESAEMHRRVTIFLDPPLKALEDRFAGGGLPAVPAVHFRSAQVRVRQQGFEQPALVWISQPHHGIQRVNGVKAFDNLDGRVLIEVAGVIPQE